MATEISLNDLTNGTIVSQEWQGAGVFDVLIAAVNKNIEIQFSKGRITGSNYADVYLGSMQAVLQQSVEFLLRKDLTEAQIDSELKNLELKEHQLIADRNKIEAELEKQWGYDVTRDANGELVLGASTGNGKVDKDIAAVVNSIETNNQEIELKTRQVVDQELTSTEQRSDIVKGIELKEQQLTNLVTEEKVTAQRIVGRAQSTVNKE